MEQKVKGTIVGSMSPEDGKTLILKAAPEIRQPHPLWQRESPLPISEAHGSILVLLPVGRHLLLIKIRLHEC